MKPLFSVIIPTYNRADLLKNAIQSVFDQAVENWEIVVVDDGSVDHTKNVVQSFDQDKIRYCFQKNKGQSVARNNGVLLSKGDYIIFMDDDDYWLEGHLKNFENSILQNPKEKKILRTGFIRFKANGQQIRAVNYDPKKHTNPVQYAAYYMCGLWTLCIPKVFLENNHSPIAFPHWQDTHLILRLLAQHPFAQLDAYTYAYVIHSKMGSLKTDSSNDILKRAQINVEAIEDLFNKHGELIIPFLPPSTLSFLKAKKFMEYANLELVIGGRKHHWRLLKRSISSKIDRRLWKHYILFFRYLVLGRPSG